MTNEDGEVERVDVEMGALPIMRRRGFDGDTLEPGDPVFIVGWSHRESNVPMVWGRSVRTQDGIVLGEDLIRGGAESEHREAAGIERLEGRWLPPVPRVGSESPLPLTPAGLIAWKNYDPQQSPANTCEPNNVPAVFHTPYLFKIRITTQEAIIHHEAYSVTRAVPLDSDPRPAEPSGIFGIVTGRIENDELVIESSDYPESAWGLGVAGGTTGGRGRCAVQPAEESDRAVFCKQRRWHAVSGLHAGGSPLSRRALFGPCGAGSRRRR